MAAQPIYIETEEEIPEVIERLRRTSSQEVPLVLPARSRMGQSRFNFELLKHFAAQLGKRVAIISSDPAVQQMAEETGFPSFRAVDQYDPLSVEPAEPAAGTSAVAAAAAARPPAAAPKPVQAATIAVRAPQRLQSKRATEVHPGRLVLYMGAALVLIAGLIAMAVYVPSATVTLVAQAKPFSQDLQVQAAPGKPPVRVRVNSVGKDATQGFKTTGVKTSPGTVATGSITYFNRCPYDLGIPNGQRLRGTGGIQFAQQGALGVPAGTAQSAPIVATSPGANGNLGSGQIYVIESNPVACLTASNPAATTGGQDEKKESQLSQTDFDAARAALEQQLRKDIADELAKQAQQGEKLSDIINYEAPVLNTDHKVGDIVASFTGTMTMKGEGAFYFVDDVKKAFTAALAAKVDPNQALTDNQVLVDYQVAANNPGGQITFKGRAGGFVGPKLDFAAIKSRLVGRTTIQAKSDLQRLPIQSVKISQRPIALPLMPLVNSRIDLRYVVNQQAPNAVTQSG